MVKALCNNKAHANKIEGACYSGGRTNMKGPRLTKVKAEVNGGANLKWSHAKVGGALAHLVGRYMVWR